MLLFTLQREFTVSTPGSLYPLLQSGVVVPYLCRKNKKEVHRPRGEASETLLALRRHGEVAASSLVLQMPHYCAWFWGSAQAQDIARKATRLENKGQKSWFCL